MTTLSEKLTKVKKQLTTIADLERRALVVLRTSRVPEAREKAIIALTLVHDAGITLQQAYESLGVATPIYAELPDLAEVDLEKARLDTDVPAKVVETMCAKLRFSATAAEVAEAFNGAFDLRIQGIQLSLINAAQCLPTNTTNRVTEARE